MSIEIPIVAKIGGTSMAQPEVPQAQLEFENNSAGVVVVSAVGKDDKFPVKTTDMLIGYSAGTVSTEELQAVYAEILRLTGMEDNARSLEVVENIPHDLRLWQAEGDSVEALGEYWSAKLFAIQTGREFVDAREIIFFKESGELDEPKTIAAINSRLIGGRLYDVPGFYGVLPNGKVCVMKRGESDTTGAIISKALGANYHNWSDVDGFKTADPKVVLGARLLERITYREAREFGNGGSQLLNRSVIKYLAGTGLRTFMRNTFGEPGNYGTVVVDQRLWQNQGVVGVTGRDDLIVLNLHQFGLNEGAGKTVDVVRELKQHGVSYEHSLDATDDVSYYIAAGEKNKHRPVVEEIVHQLGRPGRQLSLTHQTGLIHVIGEGLAYSRRSSAKRAVTNALDEARIESLGSSDLGGSATLTFFMRAKDVSRAINLAHEALDLGREPRTTF